MFVITFGKLKKYFILNLKLLKFYSQDSTSIWYLKYKTTYYTFFYFTLKYHQLCFKNITMFLNDPLMYNCIIIGIIIL